MATPVGRIEKEFLFNAIFEEKISLMHIRDRVEYILKLDQKAGEELVFSCEKPLGKLKPHTKLPIKFNYRGHVIDFTAELLAQKGDLVYCKMPAALYKNPDRNFLKVDIPSGIKITFTFQGDRYNLAFPKVSEYENITVDDLLNNLDSGNLSELIKQKENGYFEQGKAENQPFEGRALDISASGLMFAYPLGSALFAALLVDSELKVTIETKSRTINVTAKIVRKFKDKNAGYLVCRFINMAPEDTRFLFEHLYGRQIDDEADAAFLAGQV